MRLRNSVQDREGKTSLRINRRQFLAIAGAGSTALAQQIQRPNIVFILADDLGYGDLGCYGQKRFATPRIDQMAAEGIRFTQAYGGASVCAPSRCCLMTGLHTGHATVRANSANGKRIPLRPDDVTVAEVLKEAGYRTGIVGKWGLGEAGTHGVPNSQGFDEWFGFLNQDHALHYYPAHLWINRTEYFPPGNQGAKRKQYAQDLFTEKALDFIRGSAQQPFFLYLAYTTPHADSERGRDTGDGYVVPDYMPYENEDWPVPERGFACMVHRLDRDVGRVLDEVKKLGLEQNTIVIFASDNGPAKDGGHTPDYFGSRGGLRGQKGDLHEGGIRVPMIARWPGRIPAGRTSEEVCAFWDLLPTAAELAGVPTPRGVDGISLVPALRGGKLSNRPALYWEQREETFEQAVRSGYWKGIRRRGAAFELYRLDEDRAEERDLSQEHPDVVARLEAIMDNSHTPTDNYPTG